MKKEKSKRWFTLLPISVLTSTVMMVFIAADCNEITTDLGNLFTTFVDPQSVMVEQGSSVAVDISVSQAGNDINLTLIDNTIAPFIVSELQNILFTPSTINNSTSSILTFDVPLSVTPGTYDMLVKFQPSGDTQFETEDLRIIVTSPTPDFNVSFSEDSISETAYRWNRVNLPLLQ